MATRLDMVFISRTAAARDGFAQQQLRVVQPGGAVSVRDGPAGNLALLAGAAAVVPDCRGGPLFEAPNLPRLRELSPAPLLMAVIASPLALLDLHLPAHGAPARHAMRSGARSTGWQVPPATWRAEPSA